MIRYLYILTFLLFNFEIFSQSITNYYYKSSDLSIIANKDNAEYYKKVTDFNDGRRNIEIKNQKSNEIERLEYYKDGEPVGK
ncbi:MAG: hypothetical protein IPO21_19705 [Bacteroidales bacterium]|nr:hypothetical protein [Bacteroidales bacterium]